MLAKADWHVTAENARVNLDRDCGRAATPRLPPMNLDLINDRDASRNPDRLDLTSIKLLPADLCYQ